MKNADLVKALAADGWTLTRQAGSHRQFRKPGNPNVITISGKPRDEPTPGLLADVRRKTGLALR